MFTEDAHTAISKDTVIDMRDHAVAEAPEGASLGNVFAVAWRRKLIICLTIFVLTGAAAAAIWESAPNYAATATILIDPRKPEGGDLEALRSGGQLDLITVRTQADVIRSAAIATRVVDALDLTHEPIFVHAMDSPPSALRRGAAQFLERLGYTLPMQPPLTDALREQLTRVILLGHVVATNDGRSYLIAITAQTADGDLSARVANTFARAYLDFNQKLKSDTIAEANSRFDEQLAPLRRKVLDAELRVDAYRRESGLVATVMGAGGWRGPTVPEQRLAEINSQLAKASSERTEKEASLAQVVNAQRGHGQLDSLPEIVGSALIQRLRSQQAELEGRMAGLETSVMGANPNLIALRAASVDVRQKIAAEVAKIAASMASSATAARAREQSLGAELAAQEQQVAAQGQSEIRLRELESEVDAARAVYTDYLHRSEQTASQRLMQLPDAEIIASAEPPLQPTGPAKVELLVLAFALAAVVGLVLAMLVDRIGPGFRTPEELERATGLTVLGLLPTSRRGSQRLNGKQAAFMYRESVNHVRGALRFGERRHRASVVLITSALPREGKTYLATSLARSVSRTGRALLIDCDLRCPTIAKTLGLSDQLLADLTESHDPSAFEPGQTQLVIARNVAMGLDIGMLRGGASLPASLRSVREEIESARNHYDLIVIDAPPVLACAEADLFAGVADGVIMVVRWGHTRRGPVQAALRIMRVYDVRTVGAVLSRASFKQLARFGDNYASLYRHYAARSK
jgi:uncharacterized protein involved in exopolysaccharide biosynthesis